MTNFTTEILSALSDNSFEFDGQMWYAHSGDEVLVGEGGDRNDENIRVVFADADGIPYATVSMEDAPALIARVTSEDELRWLATWGRAAGYDVEAC